jgi:hypothetical protein
MKKSLFFFLGGSVFGAAVAVVLLTSGAVDNHPAAPSLSGNRGEPSGGQTESTEKRVSLPPASKSDSDLNHAASNEARSSSSNDQRPKLPGFMSVPAPGVANVDHQAREPEPPTAEQQQQQYLSMQSSLYEAAYNPSVGLADLAQQSNKLTPEQRQKLSEQAMAMIKRGELKLEQFMPQSGH